MTARPAKRHRVRDTRPPGEAERQGLMSPRAFLIGAVGVGTGVGLALAGQPWLAVPAAVGVIGGLHTILSR